MSFFVNLIHKELRLFLGQNIQNEKVSSELISSKSLPVPKDTGSKPNGSRDWSGVEYAFPWINFNRYYASCVQEEMDSSDEENKDLFTDEERRLYLRLKRERNELRRMRDENIQGVFDMTAQIRRNRRALSVLFNSVSRRAESPRVENRMPSPELIRDGTIIVSPERKIDHTKKFCWSGSGNGCKENNNPRINLNLAEDNLERVVSDANHRNRRRVFIPERYMDTLSSDHNMNNGFRFDTNILGPQSNPFENLKDSGSSQSNDSHTQAASSSNAPLGRQRNPSGAQIRNSSHMNTSDRSTSNGSHSQRPVSSTFDLFGESSDEGEMFRYDSSEQEDNEECP